MGQWQIAVLPGDGIGPEIVAEALKTLRAVEETWGHCFVFKHGWVGGAAFDREDVHLPGETLDLCTQSDAILFGSVGGPVADQHQSKWKDCEKNCLLGLRKKLNLAVNLRPAKVLPFLTHLSPLKEEHLSDGVDLLIVRELVGGVYFGLHETTEVDGQKRAVDVMEYTWDQVERAVTYGFEAAQQRPRKHITVVDKANVLDTSRLWREVARAVAPAFPDVTLEFMYVDNAAMQLMKAPGKFDVVVTENMFGDILSDAAAELPGSLGLMPTASFGAVVHMYEPAGGSAPDIAGHNAANPVGAILSAAMMLRFSMGLEAEAVAVEAAVEATLRVSRTADLHRTSDGLRPATCSEVGDAVVAHLKRAHHSEVAPCE